MKPAFFLAPILAIACVSALATGIEGDEVSFTYWYPSVGSLDYDAGTQIITGNGATFFDNFHPERADVSSQVSANTIVMTSSDRSSFSPTSYFGYVFTNLSQSFPGSYVLTSSTVDVLPNGNFYSTVGDTFVVNLAGFRGSYGQTLTFSLVSAVPEPETYAMLLAGLGLTGFISRRRQKQQAAA